MSTSAGQRALPSGPETGTDIPETAHATVAQYPSESPNPYAEVLRAPVGREAQAEARAARQAAREARELGQPAVVAQPSVSQPAASSSADTVVQPAVGAAVGATGPAVTSGSGVRPAVSAARNVVSSVGHAIAACLPRIISSCRGTRSPSAVGGMPSAGRGSRGGSRSRSRGTPPRLPPSSAGGNAAVVSGGAVPSSSQQQQTPTASGGGVVQPVAVVPPPTAPISGGGSPSHLPPSTAAPTSVPVQPSVRPRLDQEGWTGSTRRLLYDEQVTLHILHSAAERRAQSIIQHGEQAGRAPYWYINPAVGPVH